MTNMTDMTVMGRRPPKRDPGSEEEGGVDRPKKYLTGPDLVIPRDTISVATVVRNNTTGKDPEEDSI